jgi:hypothetical protein
MFDSPESGVKALHHDIGIKLNRGLDTPTKFISVYAPAGDKNDVGAYSKNVANMLGIKPNDKIPNTPEARQLLAQAIIRQEGAHKATAAFAGGGEIKHYYAGGYEDDTYSPEGVMMYGGDTRTEPEKPEWEKEWEKKYLKKPTTPPQGKASPAETEAFFNKFQNPPPSDKSQFDNVPGVANKAKEEQFNMMDYIRAREAKMDKAAEKDYALAGLAAGLKMLGGTSQYWNKNVGEGGEAGVQQLAQSQKLRAGQEAALGKLYGSASQYDLLNKTRQDALAEKAREHNERTTLASNKSLTEAIQKALGANKTNLTQLDILESQVGDPSKPLTQEQMTRLKNLREWKANTENAVRRQYATGGGGGGYAPTQSQAAALDRYS